MSVVRIFCGGSGGGDIILEDWHAKIGKATQWTAIGWYIDYTISYLNGCTAIYLYV